MHQRSMPIPRPPAVRPINISHKERKLSRPVQNWAGFCFAKSGSKISKNVPNAGGGDCVTWPRIMN